MLLAYRDYLAESRDGKGGEMVAGVRLFAMVGKSLLFFREKMAVECLEIITFAPVISSQRRPYAQCSGRRVRVGCHGSASYDKELYCISRVGPDACKQLWQLKRKGCP